MKPKHEKTYYSIFKFFFIVLLITFLALYISQSTGYYEYEQHKKIVLTEKKIKQFEEDIKAGKNLDIENYLENKTTNYQNKISKTGYNISSSIGKYVRLGIKETFGLLNKLIDDD